MGIIDKYEERDIYRGSKKYKKYKKETTKKSDHKHDYEKVIVLGKYKFSNEDSAYPLYVCTICGKEQDTEMFFNEKLSNGNIRLVTDLDEVKAMHPELRVIKKEY